MRQGVVSISSLKPTFGLLSEIKLIPTPASIMSLLGYQSSWVERQTCGSFLLCNITRYY